MQIKLCTENDIPQLLEVSTLSYLQHYTYLWHDSGESYVHSNFNYEKFRNEIVDPNSFFFLLLTEAKPVGMVKLNVNSRMGNCTAAEALELERIYIVKEASGQGLGMQTLDFIINFAQQRNKKWIWLKAMDSSRAVEFYKKFGFVILDETYLGYAQMKNEFRKMLIMGKEL